MRCNRVLLFATMISLVMLSQVRAGVVFSYTGSLQEYIVPTTGVYYISAAGAEGGHGYAGVAGLGAVLSGEYALTAGTKLEIIVGGQGTPPEIQNSNAEGGGGGGSFVYITGALQPIIVAGGGGGGGVYGELYGGVSGGQITTEGATGLGPNGGAGGTGGNGGSGGTFSQGQNGGGGAGWLSNGTAGVYGFGASGGGGFGPPTFAGGAAGGIVSGGGGFGGGGGAGNSSGGGGGGYSGGGGAGAYGVGGGGGGSYLDASFTNTILTASTHSGNGVVEIRLLSESTPVPEPSTFAVILGTGLVVFSCRRRWTRRTT
ncbi:MAG: PEP-CTERM sorting domain-containing protein [Planctomycetes bacterium]|nr:PEP-CTERM sorting domain-containing protein [Planctomycetota bacterium]